MPILAGRDAACWLVKRCGGWVLFLRATWDILNGGVFFTQGLICVSAAWFSIDCRVNLYK